MKVSADEIASAMTIRGGWTAATLASWGVPWPPMKGWREHLIAGTMPPEIRFRKLCVVAREQFVPTTYEKWREAVNARVLNLGFCYSDKSVGKAMRAVKHAHKLTFYMER